MINCKIIAMNKINYMEKWYDCDGEERLTPNVKYIFYCVENGSYFGCNQKYTVTLATTNGSCGSGWCDASWGEKTIEKVDSFGVYTHSPCKEIEVDIEEDINEVWNVDFNGDDDYYPRGTVEVQETLFKQNKRYAEKPSIYIITGEKNIGKSYLGMMLAENHTVYETDSKEYLPTKITADVIVLGKKYSFTVDEVVSHIENSYDINIKIINLSNYERF